MVDNTHATAPAPAPAAAPLPIPDISSLNSCRSSLLKYFSLNFLGLLMAWRKPEPGRIAFSVDNWSTDRLQAWADQSFNKYTEFLPLLDRYFSLYCSHFTDDYLAAHAFIPPWADEDRPEEEENNETTLRPYLGHVWWNSMLFHCRDEIRALVDQRRKLEEKKIKEKQTQIVEEGTATASEPASPPASSPAPTAVPVFPSCFPDRPLLSSWCGLVYSSTASLESLVKYAAMEFKADAADGNNTNNTEKPEKYQLKLHNGQPLIAGRREIFNAFRCKLLFYLMRYENYKKWEADKDKKGDALVAGESGATTDTMSAGASIPSSAPIEPLVTYDCPSWCVSVSSQLAALHHTYELWTEQIKEIMADPVPAGYLDRPYIPVDPAMAAIMSRIQALVDRFANAQPLDQNAWAAEAADALAGLRTIDLDDAPRVVEYFYLSISPLLSVVADADAHSGVPASSIFHPIDSRALYNPDPLISPLTRWSHSQWLSLSAPFYAALTKFRDQFRSAKDFLVAGDFPVADSAGNGIKAAILMRECSGNEEWDSPRLMAWARLCVSAGLVLQHIFHRALDKKHIKQIGDQWAAVNGRLSEAARQEAARGDGGAGDGGDSQSVLVAIEQLRREAAGQYEAMKALTEQSIQATINAATSGLPSCMLLLPDAPRKSLEDQLMHYDDLIFEQYGLHVLCEFFCRPPSNEAAHSEGHAHTHSSSEVQGLGHAATQYNPNLSPDAAMEWHMTAHPGFKLQRVRHKEFVEKAGTVLKGTLMALNAAAKVGSVLGIHVNDITQTALSRVSNVVDGLVRPTAQLAMIDREEKSASPGVPRRLHGAALDCFRDIAGINGPVEAVGGVVRSVIMRDGPAGKAGNFYWLCEAHHELVQEWNVDEQMNEEQFHNKARKIERKLKGFPEEEKPLHHEKAMGSEGAVERAKLASPSDAGEAVSVGVSVAAQVSDQGASSVAVSVQAQSADESMSVDVKLTDNKGKANEKANANAKNQVKPAGPAAVRGKAAPRAGELDGDDDAPVGCCGRRSRKKRTAKVTPMAVVPA